MRVGSHAWTGVKVRRNVDDRVPLPAQVVFKIPDGEGGVEAYYARHGRLAFRRLAKDASQLSRPFNWFARFDGCDLAAVFLCAGLVSLAGGKGQGWHGGQPKWAYQSD